MAPVRGQYALHDDLYGQHPAAEPAPDRHECRFHLLAGEIQIIFTPFNPQKAVAITVANNGTFHQVEAFRQRIALTTSEDQLTIALHRAQAATQAFKLLFAFNVQFYRQLIHGWPVFTFG
ncbi:hypothetical protein EN35_19065 [Rhodococcus qingshengii]|nr:hypothetical protein EN35_19065 [Rhodococcus qingshengii]